MDHEFLVNVVIFGIKIDKNCGSGENLVQSRQAELIDLPIDHFLENYRLWATTIST